MKFTIDPAILQQFPGVRMGVVVVSSMDNHGHSEGILKLLRDEEFHQKSLLNGIELMQLPEVSAWRTIYRAFGSDPHDYRSSIESLLRRARGGSKPLPQINNLVDIYNYLSLKYHIPFGAENISAICGDLKLRYAIGTERGRALGSDFDGTCYNGEIVYADDEGFVCRRWNWREGDRTKIEESTTSAIVVIEAVPAISDTTLKAAIDETKQLIEQHLKGSCKTYLMQNDSVSVSMEGE